MSEDRLLRSEGTDPLERALLRAGAEERPSKEARARTLAALGIAGGAVAAGGAATVATATGRAAISRLVRWVGLAVVVVVGVVMVWLALRPVQPAVSVSAPFVPSAIAPVATVPPPPDSATVATASPGDSAAAALSAPPPAPSVAARTPAPSSSAASDDNGLAAEVAALDRAREALAGGSVPAALGALDDYQRSFPHGVLGQEAAVLRIEALVKGGNTAAAKALADRFLAANPQSPHAPRIRRLVGEQDPP
jgi:hypothetical protein